MIDDDSIPVPRALRLPSDDPLESEVQAKVAAFARRRGYYARKFSSPGSVSVPDFLFLNPVGWVFFIEFKRAGKKPTPKQAEEHKRIAACNGVVFIVDNDRVGIFLVSLFEDYTPWSK